MTHTPVPIQSPVTITTGTDSAVDIKKTVYEAVLAQAQQHTNKVLIWIIGVAFGALFTIVFDLNGQIYKIAGESGLFSKVQDLEINRYKNQIEDLKKEGRLRDCLSDKRVRNKSECYHEH